MADRAFRILATAVALAVLSLTNTSQAGSPGSRSIADSYGTATAPFSPILRWDAARVQQELRRALPLLTRPGRPVRPVCRQRDARIGSHPMRHHHP